MNPVLNSIVLQVNKEAPKLLVLHGFMGMADNWKTLGGQFAELGFEVHLLDLRNHGKSFHTDTFTYSAFVSDIIEYCGQHQIATFSVIGHSMGGKTAMLLACLYPNRVQQLVVADISPRYYAPHHQVILSALNAVDFATKPSRAAVEQVLAGYITDFGTRQFLLKSLYWQSPGQLAFRFNLKVFNESIESVGEALPKNYHFDKPTLFIKGGLSDYITDQDMMAIQEHFPSAVFKTIPNVGHWLHAENPKMFFEICQEFL